MAPVIICSWCHVHNQIVDTSRPCVYSSRIQNRVRHSEAAFVNVASRDDNNQHMARARGPWSEEG